MLEIRRYIHHNMHYYDHQDNWSQDLLGHLNNLHYNKMDTLLDRNVSDLQNLGNCRC